MKQKLTRLLVVVLAVMLIISCFGIVALASDDKTVIYVATDGSDSNDGSISKPFASLEKARDTIRELKKAGNLGAGGAVVYIRGGEYLVQKTFELTAEDSGTKDAPVIYRNYPDEEVKFVGAAILSSDLFKKVTDEDVLERIVDKKAREKIVGVDMFALGYTELPEQTFPGAYSYNYNMDKIHGKKPPEAVASELVIDGKTMTIARYPNEDWLYIETVLEPGENVRMWYDDKKGTAGYIEEKDRKTTPFTITVDDERVVNWTKAKDALMYGYFYHSWADQTVPLASVNTSKYALTSKYPSVYQVNNGQHFYVYNLIEEIDMPGEYFVDRDEGMLYLYPPEGGIGSAMYTTLDKKMITLTDAEYITIKGIDMGYMRNGAVTFSNTKNCELAECSVHYTGRRAVDISGTDNRMYDCYIYDCDGGAIISGGDRATLTPGNNVVENCHFEENSRISNAYCSAVSLTGCGNKALYNKIHGSDHTVFQFSGNDHTIAYNEIYDACRFADDMGAIYTGRAITQRGNRIIHNYFHDIGSPDLGSNGVHAIFFDDFWACAEVSGNVFADITGYGMMGAGSYNAINNNVFVNVQKGIVNVNRSFAYGASNTDANYTYYYAFNNELAGVPWQSEIWQKKYPEMARINPEKNEFDVGNYIQIQNNVSFNSADIRIGAQQAATAIVENNVSFGSDPGFYNLEDKIYLLNPDSLVYEKIPDFQPILFTRMGMYNERAIARIKNAYVFQADSPYTFVNGERIKGEKNGAIIENGKVYIPLRSAIAAVGGELAFDEATKEITIATGVKQVNFKDGAKDSIFANGTEYALANPIVNIDYTNYISAEDLANLFEKKLNQYNKTVVISDIDALFTDVVDDGLLRYIDTQLGVY